MRTLVALSLAFASAAFGQDAISYRLSFPHAANRYLEKQGLRSVERNFRCRLGEIDLVMLDEECLVFVEVRLRAGKRLVPAALTVDCFKQIKLGRAAEIYLATRHEHVQRSARFDVIGIDQDVNGDLRFEWVRNAFSL